MSLGVGRVGATNTQKDFGAELPTFTIESGGLVGVPTHDAAEQGRAIESFSTLLLPSVSAV
eukprot:3057922-Alexandrium_andersonii.AAC.1